MKPKIMLSKNLTGHSVLVKAAKLSEKYLPNSLEVNPLSSSTFIARAHFWAVTAKSRDNEFQKKKNKKQGMTGKGEWDCDC